MSFKHDLIGNVSLVRWSDEITFADLEQAEAIIGRHKRTAKPGMPMLGVGIMGTGVKVPSLAVASKAKASLLRGLLDGFGAVYMVLENASWLDGVMAKVMRITFLSFLDKMKIEKDLKVVLDNSSVPLVFPANMVYVRAVESGVWCPNLRETGT
jgi:hypothetical protein